MADPATEKASAAQSFGRPAGAGRSDSQGTQAPRQAGLCVQAVQRDSVAATAARLCGRSSGAIARLIVHRKVKEPLLERILRTGEWRTGDRLDPVNRLGVLVDEAHCAKVKDYLNGGAVPLVGGTVEANFVAPAFFDGVKPGDRLGVRGALRPRTLDHHRRLDVRRH